MKQERKALLLDATAGIREEYIEEAALPVTKKAARWPRLVAAAAALVLLMGLGAWLWPEGKTPAEFLPTFAVRAYAAEGEEVVLNNAGENVILRTETSDLFPGKTVYVLDVSLEGYAGNIQELGNGNFSIFHRGPSWLQPGQSDESLAVQWLSREEDGMFGYRLIGWCDTGDQIELKICGEDRKVLHEKELKIQVTEAGYQLDVRISYTHRENRSTEELIDVIMRQDYSWHTLLSSNLDQRFLLNHTGFRELIQRPDAPAKLLELFLRSQNEKEIYPMDAIFVGLGGNNDWLLNVILSWDEVWHRLTPKEQALALGHGCSRQMLDDSDRFGRKLGCPVLVYAPATADSDTTLEVTYNGITTMQEDDHIKIFQLIGTGEDGNPTYGWRVFVCFDDPTEVTFTMRDKMGNVIDKDVILVIRYSDHYEIETVEP